MRELYLTYPQIVETVTPQLDVPQLVAQIPWGHNRTILDKLKTASGRCSNSLPLAPFNQYRAPRPMGDHTL